MEKEYRPCGLCGIGEGLPLVDLRGQDGDLYRLVRCPECGLVCVNPRPTRESLEQFYSSWFEEIDPALRLKDRRALRRIFAHTLSIIAARHPGGRILDVGCGLGCFLEFMREHGYETHGVEYSQPIVRFLRECVGLSIQRGNLIEAAFPAEDFDAITMFYLLEHLHDPMAVLREARRILKPQGTLFLRVPNFDFGRAILWLRRWGIKIRPELISILCVPHHLFYYTPGTITALMRKAGFEEVVVVSGPPTARGGRAKRMARDLAHYTAELLRLLSGGSLILTPAITVYGRRG